METGWRRPHPLYCLNLQLSFMIRSMDMAQPDEIRPTDPDLKWTGWALDMLREMVEIDGRTKRMTALQQGQILAGPEAPDYALMQSRLSRSMRLSIAMTERIRADYLSRKAEAEETGERQRRARRREQAVRAVTEAVAAPAAPATPDAAEDFERVRSAVWEKLVEDEILDVQIDTLSAEDFVREVCRWLGRRPDPALLPRGWDDGDTAGAPGADCADPGAGDGWAEPAEESEDGCPPSRLPPPDSS